MNRFLALLLALFTTAAVGADENFEIFGKYERVQPPQPTETREKVEVVEMFSYGCRHCFTFLPLISHWEETKPDYVEFRRMPAVFRESWVPGARAYYTAELLGVVDEIHKPLFEAIHVKKQKLNSKQALMKFFEEHGVNKEEFSKMYDSFAVETLVRRSTIMQERYGVDGTPSVIINGKYRTSGHMAGGHQNALQVMQSLVEQERKDTLAARRE